MKHTSRAPFLKACSTARLIAIAVPDDFERSQCIDQVLALWATPSIAERFQASSLQPRTLLDALQTQSLLGDEPLVVLEEAEKLSKAQLEILQPFLAKSLNFGRLIIAAKGKTTLLELVESQGVVFSLLDEKPWDKDKRLHAQVQARLAARGASIASDALTELLERLEKDSATLDTEVDKLLCYLERPRRIELADVEAISASSKTWSVWQMAEEIVWEGRCRAALDGPTVHSLLSSIRSQLQMGLKIAALLEQNASREEWSAALPKVFAKTLEKRTAMAAQFGSGYFRKGLEALFELELASRSGSSDPAALLDRFRAKLGSHGRR